MTAEMQRVIRNIPVIECHGHYVVSAHFGSGVPVMTVSRPEDKHSAMNLAIAYGKSAITVVPSLIMKPTDTLYTKVHSMLEDLGEWQLHYHQYVFESDAAMTAALDVFLERLEQDE